MLLIGDVFAVVAIITAIAAAMWAQITLCALLFPLKVHRSREILSLGFGNLAFSAIFGAVLLVAGFVVFNLPDPISKLIGAGILLVVYAISAIGASGIASLAADRVCILDPSISRYQAITKASTQICLVCLLPIVGWFVIAPVSFLLAFAAGWKSLRPLKATNTSSVNLTDSRTT